MELSSNLLSVTGSMTTFLAQNILPLATAGASIAKSTIVKNIDNPALDGVVAWAGPTGQAALNQARQIVDNGKQEYIEDKIGKDGLDVVKMLEGNDDLRSNLAKIMGNESGATPEESLKSLERLQEKSPEVFGQLKEIMKAEGFERVIGKLANSPILSLIEKQDGATAEPPEKLIKDLNEKLKENPKFLIETEQILDNNAQLIETAAKNPQILQQILSVTGKETESMSTIEMLDYAIENKETLESSAPLMGIFSFLQGTPMMNGGPGGGFMGAIKGMLAQFAGFIDQFLGTDLKSMFNDAAAPEDTKPKQDTKNEQTTKGKPAADQDPNKTPTTEAAPTTGPKPEDKEQKPNQQASFSPRELIDFHDNSYGASYQIANNFSNASAPQPTAVFDLKSGNFTIPGALELGADTDPAFKAEAVTMG